MLYVPDSTDCTVPELAESSSFTPSHNVYHPDSTFKRQSIDSETSFDSGYFSPLASGRNSFTPVMQQPPPYMSNMVQQSPSKIAMMASVIDELTSKPLPPDLPVLDDWDKNFIETFEENLFSLDSYEDVGLLEGLFKSPMKSPLRILSPAKGHSPKFSPHKMATHRSPYKSPHIRSPYKMDSLRKVTHMGVANRANISEMPSAHSSSGRGVAGKSIPSVFQHRTVTNMMPAETVTSSVLESGVLSPSDNRQSQAYVGIPLTNLSGTHQKRMRLDTKAVTNPRQIRKAKENSEPYSSRQKLQMARANFRLSLEKAVETAASRTFHRKSDQYPQLSKALSKPSTALAPSPTFENGCGLLDSATPRNPSPIIGNPYLEEDAEIPSSWLGGSGSEVGAYEVEPQAGCKVVIRKRKK